MVSLELRDGSVNLPLVQKRGLATDFVGALVG